GTFGSPNATSVHATAHQLRSQILTKRIGPHIPDHSNRIAKPRHSDCLIRALPARIYLKIATVNGLSRNRNPLGTRDEVDVDTADHDDRFSAHNHARHVGYATERKAPLSSPRHPEPSRRASSLAPLMPIPRGLCFARSLLLPTGPQPSFPASDHSPFQHRRNACWKPCRVPAGV